MEDNNGDKIRRVLFNEVSLMVSLVAIVIAVVLFIVKPDNQMQQDIVLIQKSIDTIENNHLSAIGKDIDGIQKKNEEQDTVIHSINIKLERILTILEK